MTQPRCLLYSGLGRFYYGGDNRRCLCPSLSDGGGLRRRLGGGGLDGRDGRRGGDGRCGGLGDLGGLLPAALRATAALPLGGGEDEGVLVLADLPLALDVPLDEGALAGEAQRIDAGALGDVGVGDGEPALPVVLGVGVGNRLVDESFRLLDGLLLAFGQSCDVSDTQHCLFPFYALIGVITFVKRIWTNQEITEPRR